MTDLPDFLKILSCRDVIAQEGRIELIVSGPLVPKRKPEDQDLPVLTAIYDKVGPVSQLRTIKGLDT